MGTARDRHLEERPDVAMVLRIAVSERVRVRLAAGEGAGVQVLHRSVARSRRTFGLVGQMARALPPVREGALECVGHGDSRAGQLEDTCRTARLPTAP